MKKSRLLNVISIIMIVFAVFGIISGLVTLAGFKTINEAMETAGMGALPLWYYIFSLIYCIFELAAGIIGVKYTSKNSVRICVIIYIAFTVLFWILDAILSSFVFTEFLNLVVPLLYFWGWSQSE